MKLFCKGEYHNSPLGLHFNVVGVIDIDDPKAEYLLKDAPENFSRELPKAEAHAHEKPIEQSKAVNAPALDKQLKEPTRKK